MSEPTTPMGLRVHEVRVYFDPATGKVLHLHQLVSSPGDEPDAEGVQNLMNRFEAGLRERFGELDYITVSAEELHDVSDPGITVDVKRRALVL